MLQLWQGTLVGSKVYLFGGEDTARRPQGDLFVLDLADMEWQSPEATGERLWPTLYERSTLLCHCGRALIPTNTRYSDSHCTICLLQHSVCIFMILTGDMG